MERIKPIVAAATWAVLLFGVYAAFMNHRGAELEVDLRPAAHVYRPEDGQAVRLMFPDRWLCAALKANESPEPFWECRPKTTLERMFRSWQDAEHAQEHEHDDEHEAPK